MNLRIVASHTIVCLCFAVASNAQIYKDPKAGIDERVEDLLSRMTLEEKIAQMNMNGMGEYRQLPYGAGVVESPFISVQEIARMSAETKRYAREHTRLGIPPIQIGECLHGQLAMGATIFPQAIAQGSTWNPALVERMASAIALEASASGVDQALSPLFDLAREPRYGRTEECYGEDPYLVARMGVAFVEGMQGKAKYTRAHGIPAHCNRWLLTDVLRGEWGFRGYVFTDYGGLSHLYNFHHVAADASEAAVMGLNVGVDFEAARPDAYAHLLELVKAGKVKEEQIDTAVRRILRAKFMAGLFEKPYPDPERLAEVVHRPEHVALALELAQESAVLLKNDSALLPLDASKLKSLAVIGPNADQVQYGDYTYTRDNRSGVTILQGLRDRLGSRVQINYAKGCDITGSDRSGIAAAVEAASKSDVAVVVLGETSVILSGLGWGVGLGENEPRDPFVSGEGYDLTSLDPPGVQRELLQAVCATGKPVVLVMVHGRPWSIDWEKDHVPAILEAWYPGEQGGNAIAGILLGDVNPSGRLNCSVPRSVGHLPVTYDYKPSARGINREPGTPEKPGRDYVFSSPAPLFAFGHGLSYTTFEYSDLKIDNNASAKTVKVSVNVRNTGSRDGKEVVQLYVNDRVSSVTTPQKMLKGFDKIELNAGEQKTVSFDLPYDELALWNASMQRVVEPGEFAVMIGRSAEDIVMSGSFVVGD